MSEKKYTVYYSPVAKDDLKSVYSYIAYTLLEKKTAADQTNRIRQEIRSLNVFPERYQLVDWEPWHQMGIRQIPVYRSNPLKTLTYQGFPASECSSLM